MPVVNEAPKRKKKRRLKKKVRITLIVFCMCLAMPLIWRLSSSMQQSALILHLPVLAVLDPVGSMASSEMQETKKSSTIQSGTADRTINDGLTRYAKDESAKSVILLDPGHGAMDPGNVAYDPQTLEEIYEKDINLKIAQLVKADLEATNPNIKVYMTRTNDDFEFESSEADLTRRTDMANSVLSMDGLDYFISIHCNAMPGGDTYTSGYAFYIKPGDTASETMAKNISSALEKKNWSSLQGILTTEGSNSLQVVSFCPTHAMLIETGYMTNPSDLAGLTDTLTLRKIADAIAAGISDSIMKDPQAGHEPCPEQEIPGAVNPSKPEKTTTA